jgi:hypothetical protein
MSKNRLSARASGAVFAAALSVALIPQPVWAGKTYNVSHSNTANLAGGSKPCPSGQSWDGTTKACVATSSINYNASKSDTGNVAAGPAACPSGEVLDPATKKCVAINAVNYNSSKSNTGNFAVRGSRSQTNIHGARSSASAKYHCSHGEYMLSNGDCVPNPPSNPN